MTSDKHLTRLIRSLEDRILLVEAKQMADRQILLGLGQEVRAVCTELRSAANGAGPLENGKNP